jgi:hypothetical protein
MKLYSVTQVLQPFADFSMVRPDVLESAAERGTYVHQICAAMAQGLFVPEIREDCTGYVQSFERWFNSTVVEVHGVELELIDNIFGIIGHVDLLCTIRGDDGITIIDLKNPATQSKTWICQVAAYDHLARCNGFNVIRNGALQLDSKGGRAKLREYTGIKDGAFAAFLGILQGARFLKGE